MNKTIYVETLRNGLVPVRFIGYCLTPLELGYNVVVEVKRKNPVYWVREVLRLPPWSIVQKSHVKDYQQYVKPADLPARTETNTLPKPIY